MKYLGRPGPGIGPSHVALGWGSNVAGHGGVYTRSKC